MNKNIIEYISNIIDKLYSNKNPIGINKKVRVIKKIKIKIHTKRNLIFLSLFVI